MMEYQNLINRLVDKSDVAAGSYEIWHLVGPRGEEYIKDCIAFTKSILEVAEKEKVPYDVFVSTLISLTQMGTHVTSLVPDSEFKYKDFGKDDPGMLNQLKRRFGIR